MQQRSPLIDKVSFTSLKLIEARCALPSQSMVNQISFVDARRYDRRAWNGVVELKGIIMDISGIADCKLISTFTPTEDRVRPCSQAKILGRVHSRHLLLSVSLSQLPQVEHARENQVLEFDELALSLHTAAAPGQHSPRKRPGRRCWRTKSTKLHTQPTPSVCSSQ